MKKLLLHLLLISAIILAVIATERLSRHRYARLRRAFQARSIELQTARRIARWNTEFQSESPKVVISQLLRDARLNAISLSGKQLETLSNRLGEIFEFLFDPSEDKYINLKIGGTAGLLITNRLSATRPLIEVKTNDCQIAIPLVLAHFWSRYFRFPFGPPTKLIFVSAKNCKGTASLSNTHATIFGGSQSLGLTVIEEAPTVDISYCGVPKPTSAEDSQGNFFHVALMTRCDGSKDVGPLYMSVQWSECDQTWVPARLFTDKSLHARILF